MAEIEQNGHKCLIFIEVPLLRIKEALDCIRLKKRDGEKIERHI